MKPLLAISLLLFSCNTDKLVSSRDKRCDTACYSGSEVFRGKGACNEGIWVCDADGAVLECKGEGKPSRETCDGIDNDCDTFVDDSFYGNRCSNACGNGYEACKNGAIVCSTREPEAEVCDSVDNNCDGIIDNIDSSAIEFCYSGSSESISKGDCHPGVWSCSFGAKVCANQKIPTTEICDNIDNDCDGVVDNGLKIPLDIVFVIDISGSMGWHMPDVVTAMRMALDLHGSDLDTRVATIEVGSQLPPHAILKSNFQSISAFKSYIITLSAMGGGTEPTIDVCYNIADLVNNPYGLSWNPVSQKKIILITDETPQSLLGPPTTLNVANSMLVDAGVSLHAFVELYDNIAFEALTNNTGGGVSNIASTVSTMASDVDKILTSSCK